MALRVQVTMQLLAASSGELPRSVGEVQCNCICMYSNHRCPTHYTTLLTRAVLSSLADTTFCLSGENCFELTIIVTI
jgi:hypothetical protein